MGINSKHTKVTGSQSGDGPAPYKKDGYAGLGPVPKSMQATKVGVTNKKGYSGPNVAQGTHEGN